MEMVELTIQKREGTGKGSAGRLRRAGHVPAVLYGVGTPETIAVSPRDVLRLIHGHEGSTRLLKVAFKHRHSPPYRLDASQPLHRWPQGRGIQDV